MEKNKNFIKDLLKDLKNTSKYLTEAYIFDGEEGMQENPEMGGEPMEHQQMDQDANGAMQNAEEQAMHAQEVIQHEPIIGKIRETAIEGLKKYSDHPTSEIYNFFKKVFLDADKVLTSDGKGK
jgi:uncharacterized protein involved in copper resistance